MTITAVRGICNITLYEAADPVRANDYLEPQSSWELGHWAIDIKGDVPKCVSYASMIASYRFDHVNYQIQLGQVS